MDIHTKTNLTCKGLCFERLIAAAAIAFQVKPSDIIVVDLCSSYAKDVSNLEMCGIRIENYFGFDNDVQSPEKAQKFHRTDLNLVTVVDLIHQSESEIHSIISKRLDGKKAHIVLCNFAIHLFAPKYEKVFQLASEWAHESCFFMCAYISHDSLIGKLVQNYERYGTGVTFDDETNTLVIQGMAQFKFEPCFTKMTPTILREKEKLGGFANNNVLETIISDDELVKSAQQGCFYPICDLDELAHETLFQECITPYMDSTLSDQIVMCLRAFVTIHKTILFKRISYL